MESVKTSDDIGFDIELAKKSVDSYSISVGIESLIIDSNGNKLYNSCSKGICDFCHKIQGLSKFQYCQNVHLYGSYQAERFGGKYVYFCPIGLVHWSSPVIKDGIMKGAVLGGPVMMVEPEEFLIDDIIMKSNIEEKYIKELKKYISGVPIIKPDVVNGLSELLFIVASYISDEKPSQFIEDREYHEQQSNISEYIHYIKTMGGDDSNTGSYPLEKEKELLSLISLGDKSGSQKVLNEIFGHIFFSTGGNLDVIKSRVLELVVLLSRAALGGGADIEQIFGLNYKYLSQVHGFQTLEDIEFWLSKIMNRFTDCVFNMNDVKHIDVIYKAINYIKTNYMKKITLEEVANSVYLSHSYFSKVFKDEMKCTFNSYVNKIRIEMSKKLLLDDSVALIDISNYVGFEDQSYFSKVFKKIVGVSPGRYREGRIKYVGM